MKNKIALIFNGVWSQYTFAKSPKYKEMFELIYVYDVNEEILENFVALVIPFQSNQKELMVNKEMYHKFLNAGKKIFIEGDAAEGLFGARWEDRPVNNYWWVISPDEPPIAETDYDHPVYNGLKPRHACWHTHGVYTKIPEFAKVIQSNKAGDIITWQQQFGDGLLLATTLDPIVEHGIQQITHLDNYVDKLVFWLCGEKPEGQFVFVKEDFGISL